jgi:hypothetical protein
MTLLYIYIVFSICLVILIYNVWDTMNIFTTSKGDMTILDALICLIPVINILLLIFVIHQFTTQRWVKNIDKFLNKPIKQLFKHN